jgi:hypothetical protein
MNSSNSFRRLQSFVVAGVLAASMGAAAQTLEGAQADPTAASPDIPLVNWSVPQFLGGSGVTTSMSLPRAVANGKVNTKNDLGMSVFVTITPCRLVDTRNLFGPAIITPGAAPFAAGETRTYRTQGNCGLPVGTSRIFAVSLAITTIPAANSGDIETVPHGAALGGTVDMVFQADQWNSVSKVVKVDTNGDFDTQVRMVSGQLHLAIDINGYYADVSNAQPGDFYSVRGTYQVDGGLFFSQNESAIGAAIRAFNNGSGSDVALAQGNNAIDILAGQIRVRDAGNNTSTPAYIHQINAGNLCVDTRYTRLNQGHVSGANASAGQILFVQEASHGGINETTPKLLRAVFAANVCNTVAGSWYLFSNSAFAVGETYNVLVINP